MTDLKAPFPWFGGKSRVAPLVWSRFGKLPNYVEPFFGSGAVLLGRPHEPHVETINDKDGFVCNFWRAVQADPDGVASYADWPVNENDLHARHVWLVERRHDLTARLEGDPDYYDAKIAGWWVWGICCWIGGEWCAGNNGPWNVVDGRLVKTGRDQGGVWRQRPHLGDGKGVHKASVSRQLPHLGSSGAGVHKASVSRQRPHLGTAGQGVTRPAVGLHDWMQALSDRLRRVRVCCGDWARVCGPSPTSTLGLTGVFLDPPYSAEAGRDGTLYAVEDLSVAHLVREWCIENQDNPKLRIALCGYEGEHDLPGWGCVPWKAHGGYANLGNAAGQENRHRERIWFSPACLRGGRLL